jgi:hypothetical protein
MQLGWVTNEFLGGCNEEGNGVGDDSEGQSWSICGFRQRAFHAGQEEEITFGSPDHEKEREKERETWKAGDVVGCFLQINTEKSINNTESRRMAYLSFTLNGQLCSKVFTISLTNADVAFYPAFSLEQDESILVNTGFATPWRFDPVQTMTATAACASGVAASSAGAVASADVASSVGVGGCAVVKRIRGVCEVNSLLNLVAGEDYIEKEVHRVEEDEKEKEKVVDESGKGTTAADVSVNDSNSKKEGSTIIQSFDPIHLESPEYATISALEGLGLDRLKFELHLRGLKVGGTLTQRAERLLAVRGVKPKKIDKRLKAK